MVDVEVQESSPASLPNPVAQTGEEKKEESSQ
jgi:hypothetical protein